MTVSARLYRWFERIPNDRLGTLLVLWLPASILWLRYLLTGFILVPATDNTFDHFPNYFFGIQAMKAGDWGMWNPYIFAGFDMATSMHGHMLHPANWIYLLFRPESFIKVHGFVCFAEVLLLTYTVFALARRMRITFWNGVFLALSVQLGAFLWFTEMHHCTQLFFAGALLVYVYSSWSERPSLLNFIYASLLLADILLWGHVAYIFGWLLSVFICLLFFECAFPQRDQLVRKWLALSASFLVALVIASYRIEPVVKFLMHEQSSMGAFNLGSWPNYVYLWLTSFVVEALGVDLGQSLAVIRGIGTTGHVATHSGFYFGTAVFVFSLYGFRSAAPRSLAALSLFALAMGGIVQFYSFQPVADVYNLLIYPFTHDSVLRILGGISVYLALAGFLINVNKFDSLNETESRAFLTVFWGVVLMFLTAWLRTLTSADFLKLPPALSGVISLKVIVVAFKGLAIAVCTYLAYLWLSRRPLILILRFALIGSIVLFALQTTFLYFAPKIFGVEVSSYFWRGFYTTSAMSILASLMAIQVLRKGVSFSTRAYLGLTIAGIFLLYPHITLVKSYDNHLEIFFGATAGLMKFMILFNLVIFILTLAPLKRAMPLIIFLTVFELCFAFKYFSHFGTEPFQKVADQMAGERPEIMSVEDLKLYRLNHATAALKIRPTELMANLNVYSGVMVYGGADSVASDSLINLMTSFQTQDSSWYIRGGFINSVEHPKLLDLLSVGYDYSPERGVYRRPTAVPRFGVFRDVKHVEDTESAKKVLLGADFSPRSTLVVESLEVANSDSSSKGIEVQVPTLLNVGLSTVEIKVGNGADSYLLFNDSFSKDWSATINGSPTQILRANMNFMAVRLKQGENLVKFSFVKQRVMDLMKVSHSLLALLLVGMVATLGIEYGRKKRR